jgi:hypothetical protein
VQNGKPRIGHSRSGPSALLLTAAKELKELHSMRGPYGIRVTEHKQRLSR